MKTKLKFIYLFALLIVGAIGYSQITELKLNPERVKLFLPYVEWKHGGAETFPEWKNNNKMLFAKEMWYYTESFYIKRNVSEEGVTLQEEIIDITRFESHRKQNEESVLLLPGFKDALVLIPAKDLIYKP